MYRVNSRRKNLSQNYQQIIINAHHICIFDKVRKAHGVYPRRTALRYVNSIAYQSDAGGHIVLRVRRIKGRPVRAVGSVGLENPRESARELWTTRTEPICPAGILLTRYQSADSYPRPRVKCLTGHLVEPWVLRGQKFENKVVIHTTALCRGWRNYLRHGHEYYGSTVFEILAFIKTHLFVS